MVIQTAIKPLLLNLSRLLKNKFVVNEEYLVSL